MTQHQSIDLAHVFNIKKDVEKFFFMRLLTKIAYSNFAWKGSSSERYPWTHYKTKRDSWVIIKMKPSTEYMKNNDNAEKGFQELSRYATLSILVSSLFWRDMIRFLRYNPGLVLSTMAMKETWSNGKHKCIARKNRCKNIESLWEELSTQN